MLKPHEEIIKLSPNGIFLSNGPGDPEPCDYAIKSIKKFLKDKIPIFGICLGHQLLSLAGGANTYKMKFDTMAQIIQYKILNQKKFI